MENISQKDLILKAHLKQIRIFLWAALLVISALVFWWSENGRYVPIKDYTILDTKSGAIHNTQKVYPKP